MAETYTHPVTHLGERFELRMLSAMREGLRERTRSGNLDPIRISRPRDVGCFGVHMRASCSPRALLPLELVGRLVEHHGVVHDGRASPSRALRGAYQRIYESYLTGECSRLCVRGYTHTVHIWLSSRFGGEPYLLTTTLE